MRDIRNITAEAVQLLKEMVAIKSPSFGEDAVCSHISAWFTDRGICHKRIGNNIVAEHITDISSPVLLLCAHIDTVTAGEDWDFDPYKPDYKNAAEIISDNLRMNRNDYAEIASCCLQSEDIVAGLGSNDDGASVVAMIAVYRYFVDRSFASLRMTEEKLRMTEEKLSMTEEKLSMTEEKHRMTEEGAANLVLVLTCEEERSGKGGMTRLWPDVLAKLEASQKYAIIGEPTGMKAATSERGLLVIDGEAKGKSGHAARNEGENAIYIALEDIEKLRNHEFSRISPRMGKVNLNVTQVNAGTAHNVIPDRCTFVIDIRPTEQYTNEEILTELQSICRSTLTARNLTNRSSATYPESPLQKTAEALGIETFSSPTTSDWMRIGCDAIKMGPGESSRSHKKDEFVTVEEIENGIRTYIEFINNL